MSRRDPVFRPPTPFSDPHTRFCSSTLSSPMLSAIVELGSAGQLSAIGVGSHGSMEISPQHSGVSHHL